MNCAARVIPIRGPESDDLGAWAAFYARLGVPVVALQDRGKTPRAGSHGVKDATTDPTTIRSRWRRWPNANIGIRCGDGLVVLDIDPRNGGHTTWDRIMAEHNPPVVPIVTTGGNGLHFYFRDPSGRVRSRKLAPGVDVQAGGKYVVAPPSIHPSGTRYTWSKAADLVATRGLPAIPTSLLDVLDPPKPKRSAPRPTAPRPRRGGLPTPYGRKALDGLVADVESAPQGQRHDAIFRAAARAGDLALEGHIVAVEAFDALLDAGRAAYNGEESDEEIERTLHAGFDKARSGGKAS